MRFNPCDLVTDVSEDTWIVVREALLPIMYWADIDVVRRRTHKMKVIERFVLETSEMLGAFSATDIEIVSGLPVNVIRAICQRLSMYGLLKEAEPETWRPASELVGEALAQDSIVELLVEKHDFVYFPLTDDLLAVRHGDTWKSLKRISPHCQAPVPTALQGKSVNQVVRGQVVNRKCLGGEEYVDLVVADGGSIIGKLCPAYLFSGLGSGTESKGSSSNTQLSVTGQLGGRAGLKVDLSSASRLLGEMAERAEKCSQKMAQAIAGSFGIELQHAPDGNLQQTGSVSWVVKISESAAESLSRSANLGSQRGITFNFDEEWLIDFAVSFQPKDISSAKYFVLDIIASTLYDVEQINDARIAEVIAGVCGGLNCDIDALNIDITDVQQWLWTLGEYHRVYAIRMAKDFAYE